MKRSFVFVFLAAAIAFAACNRVETENLPNEEDFYYTFALNNPETKSILGSDEKGKFGKWEDGDRLGTAIDNATPGYAYVTIGTPATFRIYKKGGLSVGEKIYVYYPYNSAATSVSEIPFEIPTGQNQNGVSFDFDAMPMVAEEFVVPESYASTNNNTEVGEISLINLGSVIDFQVYSNNETYASETILSVKLEAATPVAGSFSKNITTVKFDTESTLALSGFTEKEVLTTVVNAPSIGADRANAAHVYMVVAPTSGVTGSVIVKTNKAEYTYSLSTAQTFKRAGLKSFGLNLGTCQNRVAEEVKTATFVFNTVEGIKALDINVPISGQGTEVSRAQSNAVVMTGALGTNTTNIPRVWNNSGMYNFRVMKSNTLSFAVTEGTIKSIVFDVGEKFNLTVEEGNLAGSVWEGAASSVAFTNTDVDRTDINTITVSYVGGTEPTVLEMSDITCTDNEENPTSLTFSWTAVANASGYKISLDGGETYTAQTQTTFTWGNLTPETEYTIYVKAISDDALYLASAPKTQTGKTKAAESTDVEWIETALSDLNSTDIVVIVGNNGSNYAMTNDNGTGDAPVTVPVSVSNKKLVGNIAENIQWNVSVSDGKCTIYPNGVTNKWLYCTTTAETGNNNCIRVGTGDRKVFVLNDNDQLETSDTYVKRYLSIYNNADWRGYINTNLAPSIKFYKKFGDDPTPTTYSVIIASGIQNGTVSVSKASGISAGESITLTATPTDATAYEFDSWDVSGIILTDVQKKTNPLTIQMPASDITVSASFKEKSGGDQNTTTFTWSASGNTSLDDGSETATDDSGTVVAWAKNNGGTKVALNTDGMRLYQQNSFKVSNSSKKIAKIEFTIKVNPKSGAFPVPSVEVGTLTEISSSSTSMTWTGSSNEVVVVMGANSGNVAISKIVITYE